jgi:hypothetical protein
LVASLLTILDGNKMKTILLLVFLATSTSVVKAGEAERMAKYQAMVDQQYNTALQQRQAQTSVLEGLPLGTALSAGALAYSLHDQSTSNPYAVGSALGAAASMTPRFSGWTASSALRSLGWR